MAWGVTAGLTDNTDLFLEELGPDGVSVRRKGTFVPCRVRDEEIHVRGKGVRRIRILESDLGPVLTHPLPADGPFRSKPFGWSPFPWSAF